MIERRAAAVEILIVAEQLHAKAAGTSGDLRRQRRESEKAQRFVPQLDRHALLALARHREHQIQRIIRHRRRLAVARLQHHDPGAGGARPVEVYVLRSQTPEHTHRCILRVKRVSERRLAAQDHIICRRRISERGVHRYLCASISQSFHGLIAKTFLQNDVHRHSSSPKTKNRPCTRQGRRISAVPPRL